MSDVNVGIDFKLTELIDKLSEKLGVPVPFVYHFRCFS